MKSTKKSRSSSSPSTFRTFLTSDKKYNPDEIPEMVESAFSGAKIIKTNKKIAYYNIPCSFDIETSSFMDGDRKTAIMYEWTLGLNGLVMIGRTWDEFFKVLDHIVQHLQLNDEKRIILYVHNLSYEFQFIRLWLQWSKVFSIDSRKPIYAVTDTGLEFRCSYILSGYSLAKLGDELRTYQVKKLVGFLEYSKIRHSSTPLTDDEIAYCVNDVKVVMAYIQERIDEGGNITKIPYTKTGYVRKYCRNSCFYSDGTRQRGKRDFKRLRYMEIMKGMKLDPDEYRQLKRSFQGGFTHANPFYSGKELTDVSSDDFTSSYPAVMVAEQFPMSSSKLVKLTSREQFLRYLKYYCCIFDVRITGLRSKIYTDSYLSRSRCWGVQNAVVNNGRVVSADMLSTTMTEQDFSVMRAFYKWDHFEVANFRIYRKAYLPTDFVKAILKLYQDKTTLKGVDGKEIEYLKSKEMLNSCYGMAVTDIVREEITYSNIEGWGTAAPDIEKAIEGYNENKSRFLFYPWGVWVTAYARRNLFTGILAFGNDYVYSDTDSIKSLHRDKHTDYIDAYNNMIRQKLLRAVSFHGLPPETIEPETIKGVKKCLGLWDYEGTYDRFKTLGAKRYMVEKDGKINITVSGLNKNITVPFMNDRWGEDVFKHFDDGLYIPAEYTGKNTHTYIDDLRTGQVTDYLGVQAAFYEKSSVHLEQSDYSLSISQEYADYILNVKYEIN